MGPIPWKTYGVAPKPIGTPNPTTRYNSALHSSGPRMAKQIRHPRQGQDSRQSPPKKPKVLYADCHSELVRRTDNADRLGNPKKN